MKALITLIAALALGLCGFSVRAADEASAPKSAQAEQKTPAKPAAKKHAAKKPAAQAAKTRGLKKKGGKEDCTDANC